MQVIAGTVQNVQDIHDIQSIRALDLLATNIQQVPQEPIKFQMKCNVEVQGDFTVKGMSSLAELTDLQTANTQLLDANKRLQERMDEIEKRIDMLWFAPGMPGYEMSKSHYTTINE